MLEFAYSCWMGVVPVSWLVLYVVKHMQVSSFGCWADTVQRALYRALSEDQVFLQQLRCH
jgi:hypothetical protein